MPDFGTNDPLTAAIRGRGGLYNLSSGTQPGQGALDQPTNFQLPQDPGQQIQDRRQQLIDQLPNIRNRRDARNVHAELGALDRTQSQLNFQSAQYQHQRDFEANQRRYMAHDQAETAAHQLKMDRDTEIDEQGAGLMTGLLRLDALRRNGQISSEQHDSALLDLGQQNQLGLHHPVAAKMFEHFVNTADARNQFNARRLATDTTRLAAKYGVEPQVDPDTGLPSIELTHQAALQTDKGKSELFHQMNSEMLNKYGVPTGVGSLFQPVTPHTSPDNGKTIDLPFMDKQGKMGKMNVPYPMFNQMKADFQDRYNMVAPQSNTPSVATPQSQSGLQAGATRNVAGKDYSWNGTRWEPQ